MERAFGKMETKYMNLDQKYQDLQVYNYLFKIALQKDLETMTKSRDQKDKHLAIMNRENEKLYKKLEKYENGDQDTEHKVILSINKQQPSSN